MSGNPTPPPTKLHPAYSVSNIQHKVRILDGVKVTYSTWVNLFTLHARGYKVLSHIDGTTAPAKTDPRYEEWAEIDALVLQWIYGTLSDDLLVRVLEAESTAHAAWTRVKNLFTNNRGARAAALEREFTTLRLGDTSSLEAYCQRLKEIAGQLKDVGVTVDDSRLVLQLVRGLPAEYDTTASLINQTLPDFATACSMLDLEQRRHASRDDSSTALVAPSPTPSDDLPWADTKQPNPPRSKNGGGRQPTHKGRHGGKGNSRGPKSQPAASTWTPVSWSPPTWYPPWPTPPCPYPTQQGWSAPWQPWTVPASPRPPVSSRPPWRPSPPPHSDSPGHAYMTDTDTAQPTDLCQALHAMAFNPTDGQWYMDTGATSHVSADSGTLIPSTASKIQSIIVGNGQKIPVRGTGTTTIPATDRNLHLNSVLYTPHIIKNLISVRKFTTDNNVSIEFDPLGFSVKDLRTGKMILRSDSRGELYPVSSVKSRPTTTTFVP